MFTIGIDFCQRKTDNSVSADRIRFPFKRENIIRGDCVNFDAANWRFNHVQLFSEMKKNRMKTFHGAKRARYLTYCLQSFTVR